jgi:hypothetical protein
MEDHEFYVLHTEQVVTKLYTTAPTHAHVSIKSWENMSLFNPRHVSVLCGNISRGNTENINTLIVKIPGGRMWPWSKQCHFNF